MYKAYLAHTAENGRTQTVQEHLKGTARLAEDFASVFDAAEQGRLAGMAHDLGKYSEEFQRRLAGDPRKADHSAEGAAACMPHQPYAAFAVMGHHTGLPDGGSPIDTAGTFFGRLNSPRPDSSAWRGEIELPQAALPMLPEPKEGMFFTRMLFSCLTDADFLDTEAFMQGIARSANPADWDALWEKLTNYIAPWFPPKGQLNSQRCAILEQCIQEGKTEKPGLFTMTVPTGGGKTVASLAFALAQARANDMKRVIYVVPYTSIIEQTADVFRRILGEDAVLEHHSGVAFEIEQEASPETIRLAKATENWDMPVVVTTAVQFFESLYASRSSKCRKLHNIARSVIIFDEAQMLPLPYLQPCVFAMAQLVKHYGASVVLCTATQPALEPIFRKFLPEFSPVEICPSSVCQWDTFRRVTYRKAGMLEWDALADEIRAQRQALCIVNTRKNAQKLFARLDPEGSFHLSTLMCPAHRLEILREIRLRLREGQPCRVVSTSLIEAGVDVDFPTVYREEAGLDSILQAAGRCNREGKRSPEDSIVTIFRSSEVPPPLFRRAIGAGRSAMDCQEDLASPEAIHWYFRELLELSGPGAQDKEGILPLMESELFPFRKVAERFHLIGSDTITVYIPLNREAEDLIAQYRAGFRSRKLIQRLGRYGVNIYLEHFASLERAGALEHLEGDTAVLRDMALYSDSTGLSLTADSGQALFV